jgi:eukaryotic-like serine/threonine-protein kinase
MPDFDGIDWNAFVGRELANVTLIKELGRGMMGVVFVGFQKSLKRQVAVKVLHKAKVKSSAWQSFRDEGEALAVLSHPNIVPIYEMGQTDDCYFQVMQLIEGSDLRSIIKRNLKHPLPAKRLIPFPETIEIVLRTLDGLGFAHEGGVIHQDIKPANILVENRDKRPLIADFGIARIIEAEYSSEGKIVGTPLYMSPEQAGGKQVDERTDIYSMGVILFEMLVGNLPVKEESVLDIIERKKFAPETFFKARPSQVSVHIDKALETIIYKAIEPDPARRYGSCEEFISDLKRFR